MTKKTGCLGWTSFYTAIGPCGIGWSHRGIRYLNLPENSLSELRDLMKKKTGLARQSPPPSWVEEIIDRVKMHLRGERQDFSDIQLDLDKTSKFCSKIYKTTRKLKAGAVASYGDIAQEINSPKAARAVGQALGKNPVGIIIPCHRVISRNKKIGGFSAFGGKHTKEKMLAAEGVSLKGPR